MAHSSTENLIRSETHLWSTVRFRWPVWAIVVCVLVLVHLMLFGYVQNVVDMRSCIGHSSDPLMKLIPFNDNWRVVTMTMYGLVASVAVLATFIPAFQGRHYPVIRLGIASSITSKSLIGRSKHCSEKICPPTGETPTHSLNRSATNGSSIKGRSG